MSICTARAPRLPTCPVRPDWAEPTWSGPCCSGLRRRTWRWIWIDQRCKDAGGGLGTLRFFDGKGLGNQGPGGR